MRIYFAINYNISAASSEGYLNLSEITPFSWDRAYIIEDPYIGGEELDQLIGVDCNLKRSDFDSTRRIVFVKDSKFVYDYVYKWNQIEINPLGLAIDNQNCKFAVEKVGSKKLLLKFAAE